jgi:hypothetical protein
MKLKLSAYNIILTPVGLDTYLEAPNSNLSWITRYTNESLCNFPRLFKKNTQGSSLLEVSNNFFLPHFF